jgi:hypothetical protein
LFCNLTCSYVVLHIDTSSFPQGPPLSEEYHPYKPDVDIYAGRLILDSYIDPTGKFRNNNLFRNWRFQSVKINVIRLKRHIKLCKCTQMHVTMYNPQSYTQTSQCIMATVTIKRDLRLGISFADVAPADPVAPRLPSPSSPKRTEY